jgi:hypothetical protein
VLRRANLAAWTLTAVLVVFNPYAAWGLVLADPGVTPLLWVGRMVDGRGDPVAGTVVAEIRPAPSAIPSRQEVEAAERRGLVAPSVPSIPLVSARTAPDGHFELRAVMPPGVPAGYTPGGWVHVLLFAQSDEGSFGVATDSVRWLPAGGLFPAGGWISSRTRAREVERLRLSGPTSAGPVLRSLLAADLADGNERPQAITLDRPAGATAYRVAAADRGPGNPYRACTARYVEDRQDGMRTIADIDVGLDWSYRIDYQDTDTTSWEVGYERSQGDWKVAGTTSFSQSSSAGFNAEFGPYPQRFREAYQVQLVHAKVLWQCGSTTSPGPFYVRTVEPESWTGGTYNQGDPVVGCGRDERPVGGRTYGWRAKDSASRYSASAAGFGFSGQASVGYTASIRLGWKNFRENPRFVCGEAADPYRGNTRVVALD